MQYKCRPFFVFMGKTEEFCCPEIQTHILHDKMIMKKEKTYPCSAPFRGAEAHVRIGIQKDPETF